MFSPIVRDEYKTAKMNFINLCPWIQYAMCLRSCVIEIIFCRFITLTVGRIIHAVTKQQFLNAVRCMSMGLYV